MKNIFIAFIYGTILAFSFFHFFPALTGPLEFTSFTKWIFFEVTLGALCGGWIFSLTLRDKKGGKGEWATGNSLGLYTGFMLHHFVYKDITVSYVIVFLVCALIFFFCPYVVARKLRLRLTKEINELRDK